MYGGDLAFVHHDGFGAVAEGAARTLLRYLDAHRVPSGSILDLACGSGVFARELSRRGHAVVGIDRSRAMIELARRTAPDATFRVGELESAAWPAASVVTVIGEGLNYLPSATARPDLAKFFRRVAKELPPRGLLMCDLVTGPMKLLAPRSAFVERPGWAVGIEVEPAGRNRIVRRLTTFRRVGRSFRKTRETHTIALSSRDSVTRRLRAAGFGVRVRDGYDGVSALPGRTVFLARKR